MKYIIFYFDNSVPGIFSEKIDEHGNVSMVLSSPHNFVAKDEIAAKVVDVKEVTDLDNHLDKGYDFHIYQKYSPIKASEGISFDALLSVYKATDYGFVKYDKNKSSIILLNPLRIQKDKMKVFYIMHPTKFKKIPTVQDIEENLLKQKIYTMVDKDTLAHDLANIDVNIQQVHRLKSGTGQRNEIRF